MTAAERSCVVDLHNHHRDESGACDPGSATLPVASMTINVGLWGKFTKLFKG